jgi:PAS domain S-box-containing protein
MTPLGLMRRPRSIRAQLLWLSALTSTLTLVLAGLLFMVNDLDMLRRQMMRDLEVLAQVVGDNSLSALAFQVPETAEQHLGSLRREYQIRAAALYDASGRAFAHYRRDPQQPVLSTPAPSAGVRAEVNWLGLGAIEVARDLDLDGEPIGQIRIRAGTEELAAQLRRYAWLAAGILAATLSLSLLLAWRLQGRIAAPILRLAAKSEEIARRGDYSLRVGPLDGSSELRRLYRHFDAMLEQIAARDQALGEIRASLEQRVAERTQALEEVAREQRLILEALPLGVLHLVGRRIERVNPRALELFGWSEAELLGEETEKLHPDHDSFAQFGQQAYPEMARGAVFRADQRLKRKDGRLFWGRLIGQAITPGDERLGSIWMVDDIDHDKALEAELRAARERAEQASRAKDRFMADMSHELRTPLNAVLGFAQVLETTGHLGAPEREQVAAIRRGGARLAALIDQALDLARIEANRLELQPSDWDTAAFLHELETLFRARAAQAGLRLTLLARPGLPARLHADAGRLHQVLVNLLDNAIKHTKTGEVRLEVRFAAPWLHVEVADTGCGIPESLRTRIFEPFMRGQADAGGGQGAGLGLAISHRLARCMGGDLQVSSQLGHGSTFRLHIPVRVLPSQGPVTALVDGMAIGGYRRENGDTRPVRILLADDEASNRDILRGLLQPLGFVLSEAGDGVECIDRALAERPDLLLLDLRMPGLDGLAVAKRLRAEPATRACPVIAITAAAFAEDRAAALAAGCDDHLAKPVQRPALLAAIARCLGLAWITVPSSDANPVPMIKSARAEFPEALRKQLGPLLRAGDLTGMMELTEQLAADPAQAELVMELRAAAEAFDLARLRRLLES